MTRLFCLSLMIAVAACSQPTPQEKLATARSFVESGDVESAIFAYRSAVQLNPTEFTVRQELGKVYLDHGLFSDAEKEFRKALENGASSANVSGSLAKALYYQDEYNQLVEQLDPIDNPAVELDAQGELFLYLARVRENPSALDLTSLPDIENSPDLFTVAKAFTALINRQPEQTIQLLKSYETTGSEPFETNMIIANALSMLDRNTDAAAYYNTALELYDTYEPVRFLLAEQLVLAGKVTDALTHIDAILAKSPQSSYANYLRGVALLAQAEYKQALMYATIAVQNGVNIPQAQFVAGAAAYETNKLERSYRNLSFAVPALPDDHIANELLEKVRARLGYDGEESSNDEAQQADREQRGMLYAAASLRAYYPSNAEHQLRQ